MVMNIIFNNHTEGYTLGNLHEKTKMTPKLTRKQHATTWDKRKVRHPVTGKHGEDIFTSEMETIKVNTSIENKINEINIAVKKEVPRCNQRHSLKLHHTSLLLPENKKKLRLCNYHINGRIVTWNIEENTNFSFIVLKILQGYVLKLEIAWKELRIIMYETSKL